MILVKNIIFRIVRRDFSKYLKIKYVIFSVAAKCRLYEAVEMRALEKFLKQGDLVIDGGANFGIYSRRMAELVGEKGLVLSFEPLPFLCEFMRKNINQKNIRIIPKALSNQNQKLRLFIPYIGKGLLEPALASVEPLTMPTLEQIVECVKLDDHTDEGRKVSFIKIDVEGHEMQALSGGERILRKDRPIVQFEENNMRKKQDLWSRFAIGYGYQIFTIRTKMRKSKMNYYLVPVERVDSFSKILSKGFQVNAISGSK
jgi:FkbM family methyltransferase